MSSLVRAVARQRWAAQRHNTRVDAVGVRRPSESVAVRTSRRRYSSQSSVGHSAPGSAGPSSVTRYLLLAAASGFAGGAAVALALSRGNEPAVHSRPRLNDKYGSPEDFQRAIQELRDSFPDKDAVSTDPDDLHTHGYSENDYHPGASTMRIHCLSCLTDGVCRHLPECGGVPEVNGRCREDRKDCEQVQDARCTVLGRNQSGRQLQICMSMSSHGFHTFSVFSL